MDPDDEPDVVMELWVIYDHPSDYPEHFVVRVQQVLEGGGLAITPEIWLRPDLEGAREVINGNHPGGHRMDRQPNDDPKIVEVWI